MRSLRARAQLRRSGLPRSLWVGREPSSPHQTGWNLVDAVTDPGMRAAVGVYQPMSDIWFARQSLLLGWRLGRGRDLVWYWSGPSDFAAGWVKDAVLHADDGDGALSALLGEVGKPDTQGRRSQTLTLVTLRSDLGGGKLQLRPITSAQLSSLMRSPNRYTSV